MLHSQIVTALVELQEACGVADLKMSDYGIQKEECMTLANVPRSMKNPGADHWRDALCMEKTVPFGAAEEFIRHIRSEPA